MRESGTRDDQAAGSRAQPAGRHGRRGRRYPRVQRADTGADRGRNYLIAVLSTQNQSEAYGIEAIDALSAPVWQHMADQIW